MPPAAPDDPVAARARATVGRVGPGLLLIVALTAASYALARLPGAALLGPLVIAMLLGVAWRAGVPAGRDAVAPGARVAARHLLRVGIVLLGVRLDVRALIELGPWILVGSVLGVVASFAVVEGLGRVWRVPVDLRRAVAIGTAVCGASAIAAALPLLRARERHASAAIGAISLLGLVGVLGFALGDAGAVGQGERLGVLAGATLQEVGHVVAAGSMLEDTAAQVALMVKLSRVVLLAPVLVLLGWWARATPREPGARAGVPLVPGFVLGFVMLGVLASLGLLPPAAVAAASLAGTLLTAAAMAGIGLGVEARALGGAGRRALALGAVGFLVLLVVMSGYYALVAPAPS